MKVLKLLFLSFLSASVFSVLFDEASCLGKFFQNNGDCSFSGDQRIVDSGFSASQTLVNWPSEPSVLSVDGYPYVHVTVGAVCVAMRPLNLEGFWMVSNDETNQ